MDLPRVDRVPMIRAAPPVPTLGPSGVPMPEHVATRKDRVEVLLPPARLDIIHRARPLPNRLIRPPTAVPTTRIQGFTSAISPPPERRPPDRHTAADISHQRNSVVSQNYCNATNLKVA